VFGSQVTGKATKDSDIDIVVLMENTSYEKIGELCGIASKFDYDYDVILDVLPYTRKELENNCFFHDEVVNKGIFYSAA
jgi:predicted nucleotidyltransferase